MRILIALFVLCIVVSYPGYKAWQSFEEADRVMQNAFGQSYPPGVSVQNIDNIQFTFLKYRLVRFSYTGDFLKPERSGFEPVTLCHVRGFLLRSPLFESHIPRAQLENYAYYWKYEPSGKPDSNRQTLLALHKTTKAGWLLRTPWVSGTYAIDHSDQLLTWQKDPFHAKSGCKDMGV